MNTYAGGHHFGEALALLAQDDPPPDAAAIRRREERDEVMRRACLSALQRAEHTDPDLLDQTYLAWARDFVATHPPLGRPLGTGEPA